MSQESLLNESIKNYYAKKEEANAAVASKTENVKLSQTGLPENQFNNEIPPQMPKFNNVDEYIKKATTEGDPDLLVGVDVVKLPSKGLFYKNRLDEVMVEYLTSKDEDILTTPALIENGTVLDVILKRKIKTANVSVGDLLVGDKDAILIFLRASSYGKDYDVNVTDPFTGKQFKATIDLTKLKNREITEFPDERGEFTVELPMRKKVAKFRMLTAREIDEVIKKADAMKEAYNQDYNELNTLRLKTQVTEIDGKRDKMYISRFIDAMPALDSLTLRRKILEVSPGVDMNYQFTSPAGNTFKAPIVMGIDFFFPSL
jgi:hypothetical protein